MPDDMPVFLWTLHPDGLVVPCFQANHPAAVTAKRLVDPVYPGLLDPYSYDYSVKYKSELYIQPVDYSHSVASPPSLVSLYRDGRSWPVFFITRTA